MLKCSKVGLVMAVLSVGGVLASSAGAAEWHTNGPKAFSSTNAGASRLVVHPSGNIIGCTGSSITGTLNGPTSTAFPWTNAATVRPVFTGCTVSGAAGYAITCATAEFRASAYAGGTTLATAGGGVTTGTLTNIACTLSIGATNCSTLTGTVPVHAINGTPPTAGNVVLIPTLVGQHLTMHLHTACAGVPSGSGTFGAPGAGSTVTPITYTVDGPNAPYIFRTP